MASVRDLQAYNDLLDAVYPRNVGQRHVAEDRAVGARMGKKVAPVTMLSARAKGLDDIDHVCAIGVVA